MGDLEDILNPPTEDMKSLILAAAKEDEGRLEHNLKLLETWISCQNHLPKNYEKNLLVTFLRGCKHDMQRTKVKLEGYFMSRTFDEGLFRNRVMTLERDLIITTYGHVCTMPEMTPEGYRVVLRTLTSKDHTVVNVTQFVRYEMMLFDFRLHHETLTAGDIFVYDTQNIYAGHVAKILCPDFRRSLEFTQYIFPLRIKQIHFVPTSPVIVRFINIVKKVMSEKLAKRIFVHSTWEDLYKVVPKRLFPSDFGGEKKSCREITEDWKAKLVKFEDWFQKLDDVKVTGSIPKQFEQTFTDFYGVEGSFRQLNID